MPTAMFDSQLPNEFQTFTDAVIDRRWIGEANHNRREIVGAVSKAEAQVLAAIILKHNCQQSLETGVANGISTLAITQAIARNQGHHYGIDPCQFSDHQGVALTLLAEHHLQQHFTLCEGPTHLEAPKLLSQGKTFDFIFIDGMHKFDYKFLDFFYADKLLKVDGFLVFHDLLLPSTKKLAKFVLQQKNYQMLLTPTLQPSWQRKAKYLIAALVKQKPYWYQWRNHFCNLLVLQKISNTEHAWNYFENF